MKLALVLLFALAGLGCGYSKHTTPPAPGIVPTISKLNPPSVIANSGQFSLEVDGTNFAANAVVNFNGMAETTTFMSAAKVTAMIPNSAIMNSGSVPVTVTNPGTPGGIYGGGTAAATSAAMMFAIN